MAELKSKVIKGFAWNVVEKIASALFQFYVGIKVANRLFPEDYGVMAILLAFLAVFNTFVDSGFSQALIRKSSPSNSDFASAFYFNIAISIVVYALLVGISYPAASIFNMPEIIKLAPILYLVVPLGALSIMQQTVLIRNFDFRRLFIINLISMLLSGVIAVLLAVSGYGIWALIWQRLAQMSIRAILMWSFGRWKPIVGFSMAPIREMFGYSSRILATDLVNNFYNIIPQLIIGRSDKDTLGHYEQAKKLKDLPVSSTMNSMQAVTFPALSRLRHDDRKFTDGVSKVVSSMVFIMFPMMAGLIVVAPDFFVLFMEPKWHGAVPFFQILSLTGLIIPITIISYNITKSRSDGKAVLKTELIKKVFATAILIATIPFGAIPIAWGQVCIAFTDMLVSFRVGKQFSGYGVKNLLRDIMPALALTIVMFGAVWGFGLLLPEMTLWLRFALKIVVGVTVYLGGAALFRFDALGEFTEALQKATAKMRSRE